MYNTKNCAVVVLSCDDYSDCWKPFFTLKERYWSDCPYRTYLFSENIGYRNVDNVYSQSGYWTKRIRECLMKIKEDYVIVMLEDFFIRKRVDFP